MKRPKAQILKELDSEVLLWNDTCPVGTKVAFHPVIGERAYRLRTTRSAAFVLSGHTACVFLEGESGCVALEACEIVEVAR